MVKKFFIIFGIICLSVLAIIFLQGRSKYLIEKLKLELEKRNLKDKTDELEKKRQNNLNSIKELDKNDISYENKINNLTIENKKIEEKITKIKEEVSVKDSSIEDLIKDIKNL